MRLSVVLACLQLACVFAPSESPAAQGVIAQSKLARNAVAQSKAAALRGKAAKSTATRQQKTVTLPGPADAPARRARIAQPADYRSAHFLVHTDLQAKDARELLDRLESMLGLISKYWGQPCSGIIECYVVEDLAHWPADALDPAGRAKIEEGAGITLVETLSRGNTTVSAKAVVYAISSRGTPQHEAVHAYCGQTFGRLGPLWYAEGMAEMGQYWRAGDTSVRCQPHVVKYIRSQPPKPLGGILSEDGAGPGAASGDSWQNYAWRWALCHMLANNPNYAARFRPLGLGFLSGQSARFLDVYGSMSEELAFEYRFFVSHLDDGYRVDLCGWDWTRKFRAPENGSSLSARVAAGHGWQPSGVILSAGTKYDFSASGQWQTGKDARPVTADGQRDGTGRLEAVIFKDFTLSEPFALAAYGSFTAPSDGRLYLRCHDAWNQLADNKGAVSVRIKQWEKGRPLARPSRVAEEIVAPGERPP